MKTKIIQADFSGGHEIYEPIGKELEGLEIGVLGLFTIQSQKNCETTIRVSFQLADIDVVFCESIFLYQSTNISDFSQSTT